MSESDPLASIRLMTEAEAADRLRCSTRTMRNLRARRAIGFVKNYSCIRYREADLDEFIARHRVW